MTFRISRNRISIAAALLALSAFVSGSYGQSRMPLGGFIPFVGMALTNQYETLDTSALFFIAQPETSPGGSFLGPGTSAHYELALFDTGAATHIITQAASSSTGFAIDQEGFDGTNSQIIGGATGLISLEITDPLGVYAAGLGTRTGDGAQLTMNNAMLRGQSSFSILSAPSQWTLPNIIGLPMAAQHMVTIRNDQPQIFQLNGRTVRTPNVLLGELGSGATQSAQLGITRRLQMNIRPGIGFIQGPLYIYELDLITFQAHENPLSPSVIENGGLFVDVDAFHGADSLQDASFLFDTGADLTVVSQQTAARLGFDPVLDTPDFVLQVEGSGGVSGDVPGFYLDRLKLDTVGGSFELTNVPVAVLDVTNPNDPGNIVPGILGTNAFAGRNVVIDASPQIGQGGNGPSLYISNPVTDRHVWGTTAASANWVTAGSWTANGVPSVLWDAVVANVRGSNQEAVLSTVSTIYRTTISGGPGAEMTVNVATGGKLQSYSEMLIEDGGRIHLSGGALDAQFVQLDGGRLTGSGNIFVGTGPINGSVRNVAGIVAPGDPAGNHIGQFTITGDFANDENGTLAIDLGGTSTSQYDRVVASRFAFLSGHLDVTLANGFTPTVGNSFTILTTGTAGRFGEFDSLSLPSAFAWAVNYGSNSVTLQITGISMFGDFNQDGTLDCGDINLLVGAVASGSTSGNYDVNADGQVNVQDVYAWITTVKGTLVGDANLDFVVDGQDFIAWNNNKFTSRAEWCSGDFNADGVVDGQDFIAWNNNKFMSAQSAFVPEPVGGIGILLLFATLTGRRRSRTI